MITNTLKHASYVPNNGCLEIPTREEFHRYAIHTLCDKDFKTDYNPYDLIVMAERIGKSIKYSKKLERESENKRRFASMYASRKKPQNDDK